MKVLRFLMWDIPWASKSHHQRYFKSTGMDEERYSVEKTDPYMQSSFSLIKK